MPIELRYDREKGILYATVKDQLTPDELGSVLEKITSSKEYPKNVPTLWDMRAFNFNSLDRELEIRFIEVRKRYPDRGKTKLAIIVSSDFAYGMFRMYELLSISQDLPQDIMVFRNYIEGEKWLLETDRSE
jgi:hypothetical protein